MASFTFILLAFLCWGAGAYVFLLFSRSRDPGVKAFTYQRLKEKYPHRKGETPAQREAKFNEQFEYEYKMLGRLLWGLILALLFGGSMFLLLSIYFY